MRWSCVTTFSPDMPARALCDVTRLPLPFDPEAGAEAARALGHGAGAALVAGAAGSAPYLARLIQAEGPWLRDALDRPPSDSFREILTAPLAPEDLGAQLRQQKRRVALLTALADLGGTWDLAQVTGALTDFADAALGAAYRAALAAELTRGTLPGQTEADLDVGCGLVALAMGKMGAGELNFSSDIDLICLFDESRFDPADYATARAGFVRATRTAMKTLSQATAEGYVFRTDLRLRPDPSVTPVCLAMEAAERYYESLGRTWERAAHIKARVAWGDGAAGAAYLERLRPFVYRRHLDFAAIQDAHDIRLKIRDHRGLGGPITVLGHNVKLGRGGIREIEFFTQTRQLIAGGRDPGLRLRPTVDALHALTRAGWVPEEVSALLARNYEHLRNVEHRVQMVQDAQTHSLPDSAEGLRRIACLMAEGDPRTFEAHLADVLAETEAAIDPLYAGVPPDWVDSDSDLPFSETMLALTKRWPDYPALRSDRGRALFADLQPQILRALAKAGHPDESLGAFDAFLAGLPAGVQLFSLFSAQPKLVQLIVDICAVAPDLARYLSRNAGVLDAVLDGDFFAPLPDAEALAQALRAEIAGEGDYELLLDRTRRWHKERHFRIGVHLLRGLITSAEAGAAYADLAQAVLCGLWPAVCAEFARRYGTVPGRGAAVVGMGSLGAGLLHARSDLDLIVVYDAARDAVSDGRRALSAQAYYAKLTQALVTALSAMTAEGRLYEVDLRLRPSGRKGPVATSLSAFDSYQRTEARLWEHLALTRARVILGDPALANRIEAVRRDVLATGPARLAQIGAALSEMRQRFRAAGRMGAGLGLKHGPGRMQEIELAAQAQALCQASAARATVAQLGQGDALFDAAATARMAQGYATYADLQQRLRLIADSLPDAPQDWPKGAAEFVLRGQDAPDIAALMDRVSQMAQSVARAIDHRLVEFDDIAPDTPLDSPSNTSSDG